MYEYVYNVYESIIQNTDSVLIVFLIVLTLAVVIAIIPLYRQILKARKADKEHEQQRSQQMIDVVKENSTVIAKLQATLDNNGTATVKAIERIHDRIDGQAEILITVSAELAQIKTSVANSLENQREIASKTNKILVFASGGNLSQTENNNQN